MAFSSIFVVSNTLRLRTVQPCSSAAPSVAQKAIMARFQFLLPLMTKRSLPPLGNTTSRPRTGDMQVMVVKS